MKAIIHHLHVPPSPFFLDRGAKTRIFQRDRVAIRQLPISLD